MVELSQTYWSTRYSSNQTGWDIGEANQYLIDIVQESYSKEAKILVPGAGNAHEVEALYKLGYTNVYALDWAKEPLIALKKRLPEIPDSQLLHESFFDHEGRYDVILEQTFFCALDPSLRKDYVNKTYDLLNDNGVVTGLLFDVKDLPGPPFGGSIWEYSRLFSQRFEKSLFHRSYDSIKPREGRECFFKVEKFRI